MKNTTIDGVSRELLERVIESAGVRDDSPYFMDGIKELRAILDADHTENPLAMVAPAVERQEQPYGWVATSPEGLERVEAFTRSADVANRYRDAQWLVEPAFDSFAVSRHSKRLIEQQQSTIAQLEDKLNKAIDLDFQRRETIARLEARIAELESGSGEMIYQIEYLNDPGWRDTDHHQFNVASKLKGYRVRIVFAAPPAPVAVVLPERKPGIIDTDSYDEGWNACLDATAALNEPAK